MRLERVAPGVTQEAGAEERQLAAGGHGRMRVNIYGEQTRLWLRIEAVLGWLMGGREAACAVDVSCMGLKAIKWWRLGTFTPPG